MRPGEVFEAAVEYCHIMEASMTSAFRTQLRNAKVGGVTFSAHRFGRGFDVVYDNPLPVESLAIETARRLGLFLLREKDHDHLQPLDWNKG